MAFPVCHYLPVLRLSPSIATDTLCTLHDMHKLLLPLDALAQSIKSKSVPLKSTDCHRVVETHIVNVPVNISKSSSTSNDSGNNNNNNSNNDTSHNNSHHSFEARIHLRHAAMVRVEVHPTLNG